MIDAFWNRVVAINDREVDREVRLLKHITGCVMGLIGGDTIGSLIFCVDALSPRRMSQIRDGVNDQA